MGGGRNLHLSLFFFSKSGRRPEIPVLAGGQGANRIEVCCAEALGGRIVPRKLSKTSNGSRGSMVEKLLDTWERSIGQGLLQLLQSCGSQRTSRLQRMKTTTYTDLPPTLSQVTQLLNQEVWDFLLFLYRAREAPEKEMPLLKQAISLLNSLRPPQKQHSVGLEKWGAIIARFCSSYVPPSFFWWIFRGFVLLVFQGERPEKFSKSTKKCTAKTKTKIHDKSQGRSVLDAKLSLGRIFTDARHPWQLKGDRSDRAFERGVCDTSSGAIPLLHLENTRIVRKSSATRRVVRHMSSDWGSMAARWATCVPGWKPGKND